MELKEMPTRSKFLHGKQPNLGVLKYIKGGKYSDAEVGKYVYAVREGQYIEGRQYFRMDDWYTTLRRLLVEKG